MAKHKPSPVVEDAPPPEGYTVLARRYRPQRFAELIGQEHVARALENAIKGNRVAHAYLFTGARGVGKTSAARILAKCLNCEKGPTPTPCDQCSACKGIASGEDVDVLEIDAASNRGIDNIREIRSNVQYRPQRSRFKIYIIDEVHMLSREAFNALLKTLEEPPPHVKFIFATTEAQKIPITILSRCQRFDFSGIGTHAIKDRLRDIVQREKMEADDEALEMVARRAAGSMRDAQSLLDQLLAFGSDRLTADQIHALLGTAGDDRVVELAGAVLDRDPQKALDLLAALAERSLQFGELLDQLMAYWRDLMLLNCAGEQAPDLNFPSRHRAAQAKQAAALSLDTILAGLDVLSKTRERLRWSSHGRLHVEMALVRLTRLADLVPLAQLAQWVAQGRPPDASASPASARPVVPPEGLKKKLSAAAEPVISNGHTTSAATLSAENVQVIWERVLGKVGGMLANHLMRGGIPAISGPNTLVLRFPAEYNGDKEFCQESDRLERVQQALLGITDKPWQLRLEAGPPASRPPEPVVRPAAEETSGLARARKQKEEAESLPLIKRAIEMLGAQVVRVEDGFGAIAAAPARQESADDESESGEEA